MNRTSTSITIALFIAVFLTSCLTEPEDRYELVPASIPVIDSIKIAPRSVVLYGIGSSECFDDDFGNYLLRYDKDTIHVQLHSKRMAGVCLPAFSSYNVAITIPVDRGGTYTIRLPRSYYEIPDTTVVIPD